jgi:uncharacterized protein YcbK (DUF882 family)
MTVPNPEYKLSQDFTLNEFTVSESYPDLAKKIEPTDLQIMTLQVLCCGILQPIRREYGVTKILSGLRSPELNEAIGGFHKSDHLHGAAADISILSFNPVHIYQWIVQASGLPYRQVIYYPKKHFVHVSINTPWTEAKKEAWVSEGQNYVKYQEYFREDLK